MAFTDDQRLALLKTTFTYPQAAALASFISIQREFAEPVAFATILTNLTQEDLQDWWDAGGADLRQKILELAALLGVSVSAVVANKVYIPSEEIDYRICYVLLGSGTSFDSWRDTTIPALASLSAKAKELIYILLVAGKTPAAAKTFVTETLGVN